MKILTPEEEAAHNRQTWEGGIIGAIGGLAVGALGVWGASRQYPAFRQLSAPFRVFLVTSSSTFSGVILADRYSRAFEQSRHADSNYVNRSESDAAQVLGQKSGVDRLKTWVSEQRYPIVYGSWVVSMATAFGLVNRNKYLTGQQKLVQARVYAQALTLAVLVASFALEGNDLRTGKGRWEKVKVVDPDDPEGKRIIEKEIHHEAYEGEDQWMDMVSSQESKMKSRGAAVRNTANGKSKGEEQHDEKKPTNGSHKGNGNQGKSSGKTNGESKSKAQPPKQAEKSN